MRKFDKMFLDDVFYNLNSLHKIENGDAPQMQHQAMFQFMASGSTRTGRMGRAKLRGWRLQLRTEWNILKVQNDSELLKVRLKV